MDNHKDLFFSRLSILLNNTYICRANTLYDWAISINNAKKRFWNTSTKLLSFRIFIEDNITSKAIYAFDEQGFLDIRFYSLKNYPFFHEKNTRINLLDMINNCLGIKKSLNCVETSISINIKQFFSETSLNAFLLILEDTFKACEAQGIANMPVFPLDTKKACSNTSKIKTSSPSRIKAKPAFPHFPSFKRYWTDELYGLVHHVFWEPQLINRKKDDNNTKHSNEVFDRFRTLEISLNHCLNLAMRILPASLRNMFLNNFNAEKKPCDQSMEFLDVYKPIGGEPPFTQPDMAFESPNDRLFIEMKVDAKVDMQQIVKYIYLFAYWEFKTGIYKTPYLFFITKDPLLKHWKGPLDFEVSTNTSDFTVLLQKYIRSSKLEFSAIKNGRNPEIDNIAVKIASKINLGWQDWNGIYLSFFTIYRDLDLKQIKSDGDESLLNLLIGIIRELEDRKLVISKLQKQRLFFYDDPK